MSRPAPVRVVETPEFLAATRRMMDEAERSVLVDYLAYNPLAGDVIPGPAECASCAGRWRAVASAAARGWSTTTTARPCRCSLTAYAKNERANLSQADRNDFRRLTALVVESYAKRSKR